MSKDLHHIALLAGFEIEPGQSGHRQLDRQHADELAAALASDLARIAPNARAAMLIVGGVLLEPGELLQPNLPVWKALSELGEASIRQQGFQARIMALGSHQGKAAHAALQIAEVPPAGCFLTVPMLLIAPSGEADDLNRLLEAELFERGGVEPPARASLEARAGFSSIHGQLLTRADLIALQQMQMDAAGLGGFWPAVEHALLDPDLDKTLELPAALQARWQSNAQRLEISFSSFDEFDNAVEAYPLWLRSFRTLTALLDNHGVAWRAVPGAGLVADKSRNVLIQSAGPMDRPSSLTVHTHKDVGLVAWTVVEDGRLIHLYPLDTPSLKALELELRARQFNLVYQPGTISTNPKSDKLAPAGTQPGEEKP